MTTGPPMGKDGEPDYVWQAQPHDREYNTWVLSLNRYQRDNLLDLLEAIQGGDGSDLPVKAFNNGDWVGEIKSRLGKYYYDATERKEVSSWKISGKDRPNRQRNKVKE